MHVHPSKDTPSQVCTHHFVCVLVFVTVRVCVLVAAGDFVIVGVFALECVLVRVLVPAGDTVRVGELDRVDVLDGLTDAEMDAVFVDVLELVAVRELDRVTDTDAVVDRVLEGEAVVERVSEEEAVPDFVPDGDAVLDLVPDAEPLLDLVDVEDLDAVTEDVAEHEGHVKSTVGALATPRNTVLAAATASTRDVSDAGVYAYSVVGEVAYSMYNPHPSSLPARDMMRTPDSSFIPAVGVFRLHTVPASVYLPRLVVVVAAVSAIHRMDVDWNTHPYGLVVDATSSLPAGAAVIGAPVSPTSPAPKLEDPAKADPVPDTSVYASEAPFHPSSPPQVNVFVLPPTHLAVL